MEHSQYHAPLLASLLALIGCATQSATGLVAAKVSGVGALEPQSRLHEIAAVVCDEGVDASLPEPRCAVCPDGTAQYLETAGGLRVMQFTEWLLVSVDGCRHADSMPATGAGTFLLHETPQGWTRHYWEDVALASCAARDHQGRPALWCDTVTEWGDVTLATTYLVTGHSGGNVPEKLRLPTHDCLRPECSEERAECWDEGRWREETDARDGTTVLVWEGRYTEWTPRWEVDGTCHPLDGPQFEMKQRAVVERWEQRDGNWAARPAR